MQYFKIRDYDSRFIDNAPVTFWTEGSDWATISENGELYFVGDRYYTGGGRGYLVHKFRNSVPANFTWEKTVSSCIPHIVLNDIERYFKPIPVDNHAIFELNIAKAIKEPKYWMENMQIRRQVESFPSISIQNGNSNYCRVQYYLPFGMYIVESKIYRNSWQGRINSTSVDEGAMAESEKANFARTCALRAKSVGIPFSIGLAFKGNLSEIELFINTLKAAINVGNYNAHELDCGRSRARYEMSRLGIFMGNVDPNRLKTYVLRCLTARDVLKK